MHLRNEACTHCVRGLSSRGQVAWWSCAAHMVVEGNGFPRCEQRAARIAPEPELVQKVHPSNAVITGAKALDLCFLENSVPIDIEYGWLVAVPLKAVKADGAIEWQHRAPASDALIKGYSTPLADAAVGAVQRRIT